jgi:hypothetical protein
MNIEFLVFFRGALHWTLTSDISFQFKFRIPSGEGCNTTEHNLFTNNHWHNSMKITVFRDTTSYSLAGTNY